MTHCCRGAQSSVYRAACVAAPNPNRLYALLQIVCVSIVRQCCGCTLLSKIIKLIIIIPSRSIRRHPKLSHSTKQPEHRLLGNDPPRRPDGAAKHYPGHCPSATDGIMIPNLYSTAVLCPCLSHESPWSLAVMTLLAPSTVCCVLCCTLLCLMRILRRWR